MNVPLFLVLLSSLTLAHIHLTLPTVPPLSTANPNPGNTEFWNEGNVFHLKNIVTQKPERILQFTVAGFSSNSEAKLSSDSTKKSPKGPTWTTKFPNDDTLKMAQTRPIPDKRVGKAPIAEYSIVWKVARKLPRSVDCREVCFNYDATPKTPDPSSGASTQTYWYSTFLEKNQNWPLNSEKQKSSEFKATPFTTSTKDTPKVPIGSTVEYLFYSSAGFAIFIDDLHAWRIEVKADAFCVSIRETATPPEDHPREYYSLKWRILVAAGLPQLWEASIGTVGYINRPTRPPSSALLGRIIWPVSSIPQVSTKEWQEDIASFTKHPNYPPALLYIDDEMKNQPFTLPGKADNDPKALVEEFQKKGHQIAFHFSTQYSRSFTPAGISCVERQVDPTEADYHPRYCTFDFTSQQTAHWFSESLEAFQRKTAIGTFILQGGTVEDFCPQEENPLKPPNLYSVQNPVLLKYPNFLTPLYASLALPYGSGSRFALDAAFKAQRISSFVTFSINIEADSQFSTSRSMKRQLAQLIPRLLTLSLAGYQFLLPQVSFPSRPPIQEDYRRWLSACLFLPALQLSASPWNLNTVREAFETEMKKLLELRVAVHEQVQMKALVEEWIHRGVPIIRPMWAADEGDDRLLTIDDQYMLGRRLVVAPYLEQKNDGNGLYERTVYLPRGNWRDANEMSIKGGGEIKVDSKVMAVPYFIRQEKAI